MKQKYVSTSIAGRAVLIKPAVNSSQPELIQMLLVQMELVVKNPPAMQET